MLLSALMMALWSSNIYGSISKQDSKTIRDRTATHQLYLIIFDDVTDGDGVSLYLPMSIWQLLPTLLPHNSDPPGTHHNLLIITRASQLT